jgi:hypothetical protein
MNITNETVSKEEYEKTKLEMDKKQPTEKETLFADTYFGKGIAKGVTELLLNPDGDWRNVVYRSAIMTKLFPYFVRVREQGISLGRTQAISKFKEKIEKIIEKWHYEYGVKYPKAVIDIGLFKDQLNKTAQEISQEKRK